MDSIIDISQKIHKLLKIVPLKIQIFSGSINQDFLTSLIKSKAFCLSFFHLFSSKSLFSKVRGLWSLVRLYISTGPFFKNEFLSIILEKKKEPHDVRNFDYTARSWTGKSPKQFLIDWVRKNLPKSPNPSFEKVPVGRYWKCRYVFLVNWMNF